MLRLLVSLSPDGSKIVYMRRGMDKMRDRRTSRLWIINRDGTGHEKLTNRDENEAKPVRSTSTVACTLTGLGC